MRAPMDSGRPRRSARDVRGRAELAARVARPSDCPRSARRSRCSSASRPRSRSSASRELSRKLGVAKSTVHRLARTLMADGMLEQNPENENYRLGIALFGLGSLVRRRMNLSSEARQDLFALQAGDGRDGAARDPRRRGYHVRLQPGEHAGDPRELRHRRQEAGVLHRERPRDPGVPAGRYAGCRSRWPCSNGARPRPRSIRSACGGSSTRCASAALRSRTRRARRGCVRWQRPCGRRRRRRRLGGGGGARAAVVEGDARPVRAAGDQDRRGDLDASWISVSRRVLGCFARRLGRAEARPNNSRPYLERWASTSARPNLRCASPIA